jgi:uncharacterized repeat protein (TIGR03943 family)
MRIDPTRALRGLAIGVWAAFFAWLWLSGNGASYAAPRTAWVITFGAIALTVVAIGHLVAARTKHPGPAPSLRELAATAALLTPVLAVIVVPAPTLGALAVQKKQTPASAVASAADAERRSDDPLDIFDLSAASGSADYAEARRMRAGQPVAVTGLVSDVGKGGAFTIARFRASCCAADAIPFTADVTAAPDLLGPVQRNAWLEVDGKLARRKDGTFVVEAGRVSPVDPPSDPYLPY